MFLLLVYSYFLLVSKYCLEAVETGMADKINRLFENYMQLDGKFDVVLKENVLLKKRLDDLEIITDRVKEFSRENMQLKYRVTNLEKLELQIEKVLQENVFLRQEVTNLRDRVKESQHEKTFDTNTITIHHLMTTARKGFQVDRDMENLIPDHPDFEIHTQNTNRKTTEKRYREERDMENLIPDHTDFEIHTQNTNRKTTEKIYREERDMENLFPGHTDFEQHIQNNVENFRKTEKKYREGRDIENHIPDHLEMKKYTQNKGANFRNTEKGFRGEREIENAMPDHPVFDQYIPNKVTNFRKAQRAYRGERDIENAIPDHQDFEQKIQNKVLTESEISVYKRGSAGERDIITNKRLLTDTVQQPTPSLTTKVTFSVSLTAHVLLGQHQIIEYDNVLTNIGNGYDTRHGHFTAPSKAIYLLSCTVMNINGKALYIEMVKNGSRIAVMFADGNDHNVASDVIIIALEKGDMVWVRNSYTTGGSLHGSGFNTFSGTILFETA